MLRVARLKRAGKPKPLWLTFTSVSVLNAPTKCEVANNEVVTKAVVAQVEWDSATKGESEGELTFTPTVENAEKTEKEFVEIKVKSKAGQTCGVAGTYHVTGTATAVVVKPKVYGAAKELEFPTTGSENALAINKNYAARSPAVRPSVSRAAKNSRRDKVDARRQR